MEAIKLPRTKAKTMQVFKETLGARAHHMMYERERKKGGKTACGVSIKFPRSAELDLNRVYFCKKCRKIAGL